MCTYDFLGTGGPHTRFLTAGPHTRRFGVQTGEMQHLSSVLLRCGCSCDPEDRDKRGPNILSSSPSTDSRAAVARRGVVLAHNLRPSNRPKLTEEEARTLILKNTNMLDAPVGTTRASTSIKEAKAARVADDAAHKRADDCLAMAEDDFVSYLMSRPTSEITLSHDMLEVAHERCEAEIRVLRKLLHSGRDMAACRRSFIHAAHAFR